MTVSLPLTSPSLPWPLQCALDSSSALVGAISANSNMASLTVEEIERRLKPDVWLSDQLVMAFTEMLAVRHSLRARSLGLKVDLPSWTHGVFCSLMSPKVASFAERGELGDGYKHAERIRSYDIFELDCILVPLFRGAHWTAACVYPREHKVAWFDPLGAPEDQETLEAWLGLKPLSHLLRITWQLPYLRYSTESGKDESTTPAADKVFPLSPPPKATIERRTNEFDERSWCITVIRDGPVQPNQNDCGLYAMLALAELAHGWKGDEDSWGKAWRWGPELMTSEDHRALVKGHLMAIVHSRQSKCKEMGEIGGWSA